MTHKSQAIKHQKLNKVDSPCNDSPEYKYQSCIVGRMLDKLGCQPFWLNVSQSLKTCTEIEELKTFLDTYSNLSSWTPEDTDKHFTCLKPCTYIEYQVLEKQS